jgi:hypothetical protein
MTLRGSIAAETLKRHFLEETQELEDQYTLPDTFENEYTLEKGGTPWDEGVSPVAGIVDCGGGLRVMRVFWVERRAVDGVEKRAIDAG